MVRYADDSVLGFSDKSDAENVMKVLPKRFAKYGLTLHPEKTKLIDLNSQRGGSDRSFDFLGFTHYLGRSRKGLKVLKRKTSSNRLTRAIVNISKFIKLNRHMKLRELIAAINIKLRGHYSYYGITFNYYSLSRFRFEVVRSLYKWLNRRGGKRKWNWSKLTILVEQWYPLVKPLIYHSYGSTKRI